jgi:hypothetical protein
VLERLDLAAIRSRVWTRRHGDDGTGEESGARGVEDELTRSGCCGRSGAPLCGYL